MRRSLLGYELVRLQAEQIVAALCDLVAHLCRGRLARNACGVDLLHECLHIVLDHRIDALLCLRRIGLYDGIGERRTVAGLLSVRDSRHRKSRAGKHRRHRRGKRRSAQSSLHHGSSICSSVDC